MKFIVQNLPGENHFYSSADSFSGVETMRTRAWRENIRKVEIRAYDDDMEKLLHTEIMSTIV